MFQVISLLILLVLPGLVFAEGGQIQYCTDAFDEKGMWQYKDKDDLMQGLTDGTEKSAVENFFKNELDRFEYTVFSREQIIDAIRALMQYDGHEVFAEKPLKFCMQLQNIRIDEQEKTRFEPVQIAKICNLNKDLMKRQIKQIKSSFAESLTKEKKLASAQSMLNNPDAIKKIEKQDLIQYVHEVKTTPGPDAVSGTMCISLIIYPVELYTVSSK